MPKPIRSPEVIAHRGVADRYPENSLPAFQAALDDGADAIELDVHATIDGVVVVHHDPRLSPSSRSALAGRPIAALESSELAAFELAPGVVIPTLEATLAAVGSRAKVYIEIKGDGIEEPVAQVLMRSPASSAGYAVHSFDHRIVRRFVSLSPRVPGGILIVGYPVDPSSLLAAAQARDLWQECEFVDEELVRDIHASSGRVISWTCNDPVDWKRLRDLSVDGICTDRTAACVAALRE